jgi:preprotein translocase subunit SecG
MKKTIATVAAFLMVASLTLNAQEPAKEKKEKKEAGEEGKKK